MNPTTGGGYHQQHQQPVSHHISAEPKFPPTEEYSQSNYMPTNGADFFGGAHHLNHHPQSHPIQYGYQQHHHHQAASTPYGAVQLNGGYPGYGGYYGSHHPHHQVVHHAAGLHPHHHPATLAMPPEAQQPPLTCPPSMQNQPQPQQQQAMSSPTVLGSTALSPASLMSTHVPQDSLQAHGQHPHDGGSACSPAGSGSMHRDNSPDLQNQTQISQNCPTGQQQPKQGQHHSESSDPDEMDEDHMMESPGLGEDDDEEEENGDRVIYPWMKKIHVAGVGKFWTLLEEIFLFNNCMENFLRLEGFNQKKML